MKYHRLWSHKNMDYSEGENYFVDPNSDDDRKPFPSLSDNSTIYLSVIVPCKDEQRRLPLMLDECLDYLECRRKTDPSFTYEVIIVDDGSSDNTSSVALEYSRRFTTDRVRVLTLEENRGKGGAVRSGFSVARGRYLLFADADGATRFNDFEKLESQMISLTSANGPGRERREDDRKRLVSGRGVVIGSRAHLEKDSVAHRSLFRTILMYGFHFLVWLFCVRTVKDTQCGFKLFTRPTARLLFSNMHVQRWAFDVELLFISERLNIPIREVAVQWHEVDGSKLTPWKASLEMAKDILLIWLRYLLGIWMIKPEQHAQ